MKVIDLVKLSGLSVDQVARVVSLVRVEVCDFGRPRVLSPLREVLLVLVWLKLGSTELEVSVLKVIHKSGEVASLPLEST